jgi:hypothetical protein
MSMDVTPTADGGMQGLWHFEDMPNSFSFIPLSQISMMLPQGEADSQQPAAAPVLSAEAGKTLHHRGPTGAPPVTVHVSPMCHPCLMRVRTQRARWFVCVRETPTSLLRVLGACSAAGLTSTAPRRQGMESSEDTTTSLDKDGSSLSSVTSVSIPRPHMIAGCK